MYLGGNNIIMFCGNQRNVQPISDFSFSLIVITDNITPYLLPEDESTVSLNERVKMKRKHSPARYVESDSDEDQNEGEEPTLERFD